MTRPTRLGDWLARPSTIAALVLAVVGVLFVLLEAQSPSSLYWTGRTVPGTNSGGIVYYRVDGEHYTLNAAGPAPAHDTATTVYYDPDDPSHALVEAPTRWVDAAGMLAWFVAAAACVSVAPLRRRARRRRAAATSTGTSGQDPDWIARHLERSRDPARRPPGR